MKSATRASFSTNLLQKSKCILSMQTICGQSYSQ